MATMNPRKGMRRLVLVLGCTGVLVGGFASYLQLQPILLHNRFERLANSDAVTQARRKETHQSELNREFGLDNGTRKLGSGTATVNQDGISTISWDDNGIESIETDDGQTLYPTPAPSMRTYLLIPLFPFLGFLIPWGATRTVQSDLVKRSKWIRPGRYSQLFVLILVTAWIVVVTLYEECIADAPSLREAVFFWVPAVAVGLIAFWWLGKESSD